MRRLLAALILCSSWCAAAVSVTVYPASRTSPVGTPQSIVAIVNGSADRRVTFSIDNSGSLYTMADCKNEDCTAALTIGLPAGTYHVTATSVADPSKTAVSTITLVASPTPNTGHPRLGFTSSDVTAMRAKATGTNQVYQQIKTNATNNYNTLNSSPILYDWTSWNGSICTGATGQPAVDRTQNNDIQSGYLFAFMSLVAPTSGERETWGCRAHDILMYYATYYTSVAARTTFDQPANSNTYGMTGNRGSDFSPAWMFTPDWLMGGGFLSSSELTTIRAYFAQMGKDNVAICVTGTCPIVTNYNTPTQVSNGSNDFNYTGQRATGNNYTHNKILMLVAAGLTFDDNTTDDPPLANTCSATRYQVCSDGTAGSLHAFWYLAAGSLLYKEFVHMEPAEIAQQALNAAYSNVPSVNSFACKQWWSGSGTFACGGDGRGGQSSEGSWYQYSMYRLRLALNAIHTAGYDDPLLYGPQVGVVTSSWWDQKYLYDLAYLSQQYGSVGTQQWQYFTTGDSSSAARVVNDFYTLTTLNNFYLSESDTSYFHGTSWTLLTVPWAHPTRFYIDFNVYPLMQPDMMYMYALNPSYTDNPASSPPSDPRTSLPADLYSAGNQNLIARSGYTTSDTTFAAYCPWTGIDHEHSFCGRFDLVYKNDYLVKGRTEFNDYNEAMTSCDNQPIACIVNNSSQTDCTVAGGCFEGKTATRGGQAWHAYQGGAPVSLLHTISPTYVSYTADMTSFYNWASFQWPQISTNVTHASRSLVYNRSANMVFYYDRGITANAQTKRTFQVVTQASPTYSGNTVTWNSHYSIGKARFTSVLPAGASIVDNGLEAPAVGDDFIPQDTFYVDGGSATSKQFLSCLEWGDFSSFTPGTCTSVSSSAGTNYDGAVLGTNLAMFKRTYSDTVSTVTFPASSATWIAVADLLPSTTYSLSCSGCSASVTTDTAGTAVFSAGGSGNVVITNSAPVVNPAPAPFFAFNWSGWLFRGGR